MQTKQQKNMHIARRVQRSRDQPSRDSFVVHAFAEIGRLEFAQMQTNTHRKQRRECLAENPPSRNFAHLHLKFWVLKLI